MEYFSSDGVLDFNSFTYQKIFTAINPAGNTFENAPLAINTTFYFVNMPAYDGFTSIQTIILPQGNITYTRVYSQEDEAFSDWESASGNTSLLTFKGTYNAATNTPTLVNGVGVEGDWYLNTEEGSNNPTGELMEPNQPIFCNDLLDWEAGALISNTDEIVVADTYIAINGQIIQVGQSVTTALGALQGQLNAINSTLYKVSTTAINYTLLASDNILEVTNSNLTITLPDATLVSRGKPYYVKNQNTTDTTINTLLGQTIDGQATWGVADPWNSFGFYSNGTNWRTL